MNLDSSGSPPGPSPTVYTRRRAELPGSPRRVLRIAADADPSPADAGVVARAAEWAGAPLAVRAAWDAVAAHPGTGPDPTGDECDGVHAAWLRAAGLTAAWLRPDREPAERDREKALARAVAAAERCGRCGRWWVVGVGDVAVDRMLLERCNGRACLACMRRRLRAVVDRWAPLYAVQPRAGWRTSFVTVGYRERVADGIAVRRYLRAVGRLCRMMREGCARFGIAPRSWAAGLRALEVLPRTEGGWSHVHLVVVRSEFYPYGRHLEALHREGCPTPTAERWPCRGCGAAPEPAELGFRAVLRSVGIGEVFRDDRVTRGADDDGGRAVAAYMAKIERYMSKVVPDDERGDTAEAVAARLTWDGRRDILAAMRGVRLLQPFGDALGALGGPDRVTMEEQGEPVRLLQRGHDLYDPTDPATVPALREWVDYAGSPVEDLPPAAKPDGRAVDRVTYYAGDVLERWAAWGHVDALRARMLA